MICKVFCFICLFLFVDQSFSKTSEISYKIESVHGPVFFWKPLGSLWSQVQVHQIITLGTILKNPPGSSFSMSRLSSSEKKTFTFKEEITIRALKDISVPQSDTLFFAKKTKNQDNTMTEDLGPSHLLEKITGLLNSNNLTNTLLNIFDNEKTLQISQAIQYKKIKLLEPTNNTNRFTYFLPYKLYIQWELIPSFDGEYLIYIWEKGSTRTHPITHTDTYIHTAHLAKEGSFFIQIITDNQEYASEIYSLNITKISEDLSHPHLGEAILLDYPKNNSFFAHHTHMETLFTWHTLGQSAFTNVSIHLEDIDDVNKKTSKIDIKSGKNFLHLKHQRSHLNWWIEATANQNKIISEKRTLTVLHPSHKLDDIIKKIESHRYATFYLHTL